MGSQHLWQKTPLIRSSSISKILGINAYLKLENLQPSYSFKFRGISLFVQRAKERYGSSVHLVIASGGNAGLAAACAAKALALKCTVYLPEGAAPGTVRQFETENAVVIIAGRHYAEALMAAQDTVSKGGNAVMVPAYDHDILWEGHGSIVEEIKEQLTGAPLAIFCSVGGGGLLGGLIEGCRKVGWEDVPIVALETIGSDCFYHSMSINSGRFNAAAMRLPEGVDVVEDKTNGVYLAHFTKFSSKASGSLGASQPSARVVEMALQRPGGVICASVPDELSMQTLLSFAGGMEFSNGRLNKSNELGIDGYIDDHRMLVELACSTTLAPAYKIHLFNELVTRHDSDGRCVVFVVCGGFKISIELVHLVISVVLPHAPPVLRVSRL